MSVSEATKQHAMNQVKNFFKHGFMIIKYAIVNCFMDGSIRMDQYGSNVVRAVTKYIKDKRNVAEFANAWARRRLEEACECMALLTDDSIAQGLFMTKIVHGWTTAVRELVLK